MSTGEGHAVGADQRGDHQDRERRGERIGIGAVDESVTRIQLAARWAESYAVAGDSLSGVLKRFRVAYEYLDAVTHGVEPPDLERDTRPASQPPSPPPPQPEAAPPAPPAAPQAEPRSW